MLCFRTQEVIRLIQRCSYSYVNLGDSCDSEVLLEVCKSIFFFYKKFQGLAFFYPRTKQHHGDLINLDTKVLKEHIWLGVKNAVS